MTAAAAKASAPKTAALTLDGLGVSFAGFKAVQNVSTVIEQGELRVILGANGTGKTTLMDLISGKTRNTEGRVYIYHTEITHWQEHRVARAGLGRKFQIPSVFRDLSVRRNLEVASFSSPSVFANLGLGLTSENKRSVEHALDLTGLGLQADRLAGSLSHGQAQWLELGMLITRNPKILLLDEPTAGMTQAETHKTTEILNVLRGKHTIIVVEHDMAFVREVARRITVMHLGKILAEGDIKVIEQDERVKNAHLGSKGIT